MAMNRRRFVKVSLGALITAPCLWIAERVAPVRYTEALRARWYPGRVKRSDPEAIRRPGKWIG